MSNTRDMLRQRLSTDFSALEIGVLIGSRARGQAHADSDWDFAIQWSREISDPWERLKKTEALRQQLAKWLGTSPDQIDLVDIPSARLAIRAAIAEEGIPLKGDDDLPWFHFLSRTWRELEEYYWDDIYAA
ncbi:type VII toxin-antitoxin system MntA family adenylyltransferase antitoxin [Marinimicrobium agarilyticum]|uniref:type VII toxin-antitoxin system MntA family adenylyltransferase antitoxin n=1 Tax=Marinimicrobium agarilyticum TaxID=306546 RepID=UPI00041191AC|nr:nucleotidyltransferase domain-containing protein [Marinimicrobium agarilyticum]